ncbi:MAG TPA: hypothetical protein VK165_20230 [Azonexus sp.]|nr:hypothetical protein [Azonexus sp.]
MPRRHTPIEQYRQAQLIAKDHNLLISERAAGRYMLFRKTPGKPAYLGRTSGADGLYRLVSRFAH